MSRQLLLLPTFDGQTRGTAVINPDAIDYIKPAMMPGMTNIYLRGDLNVNSVGVAYDFPKLLEVLETAGFVYIDCGGSRAKPDYSQNNNDH